MYSVDSLNTTLPYVIGDFTILAIPVNHGQEKCYSYLIQSCGKKILFCTDLSQMPNIKDTHFDLMMLECNYSEEILNKCVDLDSPVNLGCQDHMSLEQLEEWFSERQYLPNNLVLIHMSNSNLLDFNIVVEKLKPFAQKVCIARPELEIKF